MQESLITFHEFGILVQGGCIVGFDHDELSIFREQYDFFSRSGIPSIQVMPLQAPDGSPLKDRMIREGRYNDWETVTRSDPERMNSLNVFTVTPGRMSLEQLREGLCWLLRELYRPESYVYRVNTFYRNFENSPVRKKLRIPGPSFDWYSINLTLRLLDFVLRKSTAEEKKTFWEIFKIASRSSHPTRMLFLVNLFLTHVNTTNIIRKSFPDIDRVGYPRMEAGTVQHLV